MNSYKIVSDTFTLGKKGQLIDEKELEGANIAALLEGGHIEQVMSAKKTDEPTKDNK